MAGGRLAHAFWALPAIRQPDGFRAFCGLTAGARPCGRAASKDIDPPEDYGAQAGARLAATTQAGSARGQDAKKARTQRGHGDFAISLAIFAVVTVG